MLPEHYKFHIVNNTGQTLNFNTDAEETANAKSRPWKFGTDGAINYKGSEVTVLAATGDLTDGSNEEGSSQDNTTDKYIGMHGTFTVTTNNASVNGDVMLGVEYSTNGGTTYPSDSLQFDPDVHLIPLCVINFASASGAKSKNWEL